MEMSDEVELKLPLSAEEEAMLQRHKEMLLAWLSVSKRRAAAGYNYNIAAM